MKKWKETEIIIVGSGVGGSSLAKELSRRGKQIIIIEAGKYPKKLGTLGGALNIYDKYGLLRSVEGTFLYRAITVGGTAVVSCGCGIRSLQKGFLDFGIDLKREFVEAEEELNVERYPEEKVGKASEKLIETARKLGYQMEVMSKFINMKKCKSCGNCVLGCKYGAKWTPNSFLHQAIANGAQLISRTKVNRVLSSGGKVLGVEVIGPEGRDKIRAEKVILAAGGLGTPVILQKSGIPNAGRKLFCDLFNVTYGAIDTENINQLKEIPMAIVDTQFYESEGFILSSFIDPSIQFELFTGWKSIFGKLSRERSLGIMTKIRDESIGRVDINGKIKKPVTMEDKKKLDRGVEIAKEILRKAGVNPKSILVTQARGAHPGGTAAIGEIIDKNLETEIKNLFVCDASVFPTAPGLPPILTIIALAKWFSKRVIL
ncbi:MAG: GMC family oxidoreductase N-terminal domain-containing protein [Candidatus Heimdallarchaeaceae archaeon]